MFVQFEMVLPRILEQVCAGSTVDSAIASLRPLINLDTGAFLRWLKKRPNFYSMYIEAKEVRAEVWTGRMVQHASGVDNDGLPGVNDVSRDKLAVDTYKWLISVQHRKEYGDIKQIEVNQQISIVGALDAARSRVQRVVDDVVDVDVLTSQEIRQLPAVSDDSDEEDEDE